MTFVTSHRGTAWTFFFLPTKGQLTSKCFFSVFDFFQKTNENKSNWDTIVVKLNSFVWFLEESSAWKNHYDFVWPLAYLFRIHLYAYVRQLLIKSGQKCGTVKSQKNRSTMAAFGIFFPKSIWDKFQSYLGTNVWVKIKATLVMLILKVNICRSSYVVIFFTRWYLKLRSVSNTFWTKIPKNSHFGTGPVWLKEENSFM